jgi:hypothetical protein
LTAEEIVEISNWDARFATYSEEQKRIVKLAIAKKEEWHKIIDHGPWKN